MGEGAANTLWLTAVQLSEQAKNAIEALRAAREDESYDGRSLSIATTHLETAQLWLANARQN